MTLRERLSDDLKQAMRDRNVELRDTIRFLLAAVKNAEIEKRETLNDEEELGVLRFQAKQRRDAIEQFRSGGREDLADKEAAQLEILERYLPEQMTDQDLDAFVREGIAEAGAETPRDMGKVMTLLTKRSDGRVDGRRLSAAVRALLTSK